MKTGHGSRRYFRLLVAVGVAVLAILAVPWPASAAQSAGSGRTQGLSVTVDRGKVTAKGGRVVGSVTFGSRLTVTTVTSSDAAAAPWVCTVHSYDPTKNGPTVSVQADMSCTGSGFMPIQVCDQVQRLRWWGWQNVGNRSCSGYAYVYADYTTARYNCAGTGTYNYNGAADGYAQGGAYTSGEVDSVHNPRWSC
jgi:hypothetical protein